MIGMELDEEIIEQDPLDNQFGYTDDEFFYPDTPKGRRQILDAYDLDYIKKDSLYDAIVNKEEIDMKDVCKYLKETDRNSCIENEIYELED